VLDLGLPDMTVIEVLAGLRGRLTAPVIVLSNPFGMDEFLARSRAAVRRSAAASDTDEPVIETSSFTVDLAVAGEQWPSEGVSAAEGELASLCVPMQMSIHATPSLSTRLHRSRGHSGNSRTLNNAAVQVTAPATFGPALRAGVVDSIKQMHARELR
jgi:DNA-binding response OmpR family regulator